MPQYKVKTGQTHGAQKQYKGGDVVELTVEEAAGFADKLELIEGNGSAPRAGGDPRQGELVVATPSTEETKTPTLRAAILAATDEELIAIPGIGEKSLDALRAWAREEPSPQRDEETEPATQNPPGQSPPEQPSATSLTDVEKELEAETGHDFIRTGTQPPTLAETEKPAETTGTPALTTAPQGSGQSTTDATANKGKSKP